MDTRLALWVFCMAKKLLVEAERDELIWNARATNGGDDGIVDGRNYYEREKMPVDKSSYFGAYS